MYDPFRDYSSNARAAAKQHTPDLDFWLKYLVSTVYISELHTRINYVAAVPGHQPAHGSDHMNDVLRTFAKCFKSITFIPDLIERHTASTKSQTARTQGIRIDHTNQLNTIRLNPRPWRNATTRYVRRTTGRSRRRAERRSADREHEAALFAVSVTGDRTLAAGRGHVTCRATCGLCLRSASSSPRWSPAPSPSTHPRRSQARRP